MKMSPGYRAVLYLSRHPGFENRMQLGDIYTTLGILPGVALQQRINDKARCRYGIRKHYEHVQGCVKRAFYWVTVKEARRIIKEYEARIARMAA